MKAINKAVKNGHLDILIILHKKGCYWDEATCSLAAENGHIECLIYVSQVCS